MKAFVGGKVRRRSTIKRPSAIESKNEDVPSDVPLGDELREYELTTMLERDLKSQLEQQQKQRESLLQLAKQGGSFRENTGGLEGASRVLRGHPRKMSDTAQDILEGVREQRLMQMNMGTFSQVR